MSRKLKLWSGISTVALVSAAALAGCDSGTDENKQPPSQTTTENPAPEAVTENAPPAQPEASGEGEGEGAGEGARAGADPATDDVAYLTQIGLMRGHLFVGIELFRTGAIDHARTHMKHPEDELYGDVVPAFEARGARGFAAELEALATAVEGDGEADTVETAYKALLDAMAEAEAAVNPATNEQPGPRLQVIVNLVRTAGDEYAIGVVDGKIVNGHEYQDAYGFTQIAKQIVTSIDDKGDDTLSADLTKIMGLLTDLDVAWPNIVPPETVETEASLLYGAAARIEIIALGYK